MKVILSLAITALLCIVASGVNAQTADTTITIKVKGICCSNDLNKIESNVKKLKGVKFCKNIKQGATARFEVQYTPSLVTVEQIYSTIEKTGNCENPNEKPFSIKKK